MVDVRLSPALPIGINALSVLDGNQAIIDQAGPVSGQEFGRR